MGTEILRPQDCLLERMRVSPAALYRRRSNYGNFNSNYTNYSNYYNSRPNRKPAVRPDQRKRVGSPPAQSETSISRKSSCNDLRAGRNNLVMEKVTILRRGESLDSMIKSSVSSSRKDIDAGLTVTGTERLGPDPEMVPKQIRIVDLKQHPVAGYSDVYAGSAFSVSPVPSSLPLPSFSRKKEVFVDDSATRDLRRLLRLDF